MKDLTVVWIFIVIIPIIGLLLLSPISESINIDNRFNAEICMNPNQNCVDIQGENL